MNNQKHNFPFGPLLVVLNLTEEKIHHIIRTFRGFLEGYALLVNNGAFGNPASVKESFALSVEIILNGIEALEKR